MNRALADLLFAGVYFHVCIYSLAAQFTRSSTIFRVIHTATTQASFITAVLMAAERFNAIYWPLKHRTISMRAWLVILTARTLAFLLTVFLLHLTNSPLALFGNIHKLNQTLGTWTVYLYSQQRSSFTTPYIH